MVIIHESAIRNKSVNYNSAVFKRNYMSDLSKRNSMEFTSHLNKKKRTHVDIVTAGPVFIYTKPGQLVA